MSSMDRGREAEAPVAIPARGWKDVLKRTLAEVKQDRVTLVAAGATYFMLLALFPTMAAFVSLYGLFTDPVTVQEHLSLVSAFVPAGGLELIRDQLTALTEQGGATLGWGLLISLALALWSASKGVKTMFEAMNVAYDERESRNFLKLNAMALAFTLAGLVGAILMLGVVVVLPGIINLLPLSSGAEILVQVAGYALVALGLFVGIAALYRFGPSRRAAKWRWLTPGALLAVGLVLVVSVLFSWYSANFANYEKTYGSLGGLIGFLTWIWISISIVLVGAELNSEAEHQTARDSTVGPDRPMGERRAVMADTLGEIPDDAEATQEKDGRIAATEQADRPEHRRSGLRLSKLPLALGLFLVQRSRARADRADDVRGAHGAQH